MSGVIPDYLKKNFDPNTLSIPQLRSILKDHGVENVPPPNQPKRVFIRLFNNEIWDNREEILKQLNIEEPKKRKGRPKKTDRANESSESLKPELPQSLRGKSESPVGKEVKNKRVSFGMNEIKVQYEPINTTTKKSALKTSDIKPAIKEEKKEKKPLIQNTINRLNEDHEHNNVYLKPYKQEQSGIQTGNVKRARQVFNEDNKQKTIEIKKENRVTEEEPSPKKRKQSEKLASKSSKANTSISNIFQKYDNQNESIPPSSASSSSKIPKANIVFAEENDDEEEDEDYVYQSNSPSMSTSDDEDINDEEMADLERDSASTSNINFSEGSYQEIPVSTSSSGVSTPQLDNINYVQSMSESQNPASNVSKLEKPKKSHKASISFSYDKGDNSFSRSNRLDKPQSHSFSYNRSNNNNSFAKYSKPEKPISSSFSYSNRKSKKSEKPDYSPSSNFLKSTHASKKIPSPYNTSFNEKPKINISYDMSPIQSSHDSVLYDDSLHDNSNVIGNLYNSVSEGDHDDEELEIATSGCSGISLVNVLAFLFTFLSVATSGLFLQWYLHTGGFAGYCDRNHLTMKEMTYLDMLPEDSIIRYNPFYHILPKCLNCPKNAICLNDHVIGCREKDDKLQKRLISSLIPKKFLVFPLTEPVCSFDYEKKRNYDRLLQNTRSLMSISMDIIQKKLGEIECDEKYEIVDGVRLPPKRINVSKIGITESKLRDLLKKEIGGKIREQRFETLWNFMLEKLKKYDDESVKTLCSEGGKKKWKTTEIKDDRFFCDVLRKLKYVSREGDEIEYDKNGEKFYTREGLFVTSEKPVHSFKCRMKWFMERYVYHNINRLLHRFWKYGLGMTIITMLAGLVDFIVKKRTRRTNVVNSICEEVIWLLQEAEYQNKEDPLHFPSPNISVAQLYDVLLPAVISPKDKNVPEGDCVEIVNNDGSTTHYWVFHNPKERALIWKRVYDQVRANSNVLESNALVKRESHRCWEWIGNPTLYIRRKSPNTMNKQTTYYPKVANNSRLSLGGASNRSFNSQAFVGDISAISNAEGRGNESYVSLNENDEPDNDTSLRGHINKLSIFNQRRQSRGKSEEAEEDVGEEEEGDEGEGETETSRSNKKSSTSSSSSIYPRL